ncbi:hypothetical protein HDV03_001388 [Kappamyces sp. JEL0829]|nr:hypothetical protein HDV03_001388 [Kappamyces sp. JEL0829]
MSTRRFVGTAAFAAPSPKVVVHRLGFRSSLFGFLVGSLLTGFACFEYLIDDYKNQSHSLLSGVEDVSKSTKQIGKQVARIDALQDTVNVFSTQYASKQDMLELRQELLRMLDLVHIESLETKTKVFELEQKK